MNDKLSFFRRAAWLTTTLLVLNSLAGSFPAGAQASDDGSLQGFERVDDQQLLVGGVPDPKAQIFVQRKLPAYLIVPSSSNLALVVLARTREVRTANLMKMQDVGGGLIDLQADAFYGPSSSFEIDENGVRFSVNGTSYKLTERPELLGLMPAKSLEDYSRIYIDRADTYSLDGPAMEALKKTARKVHVRVYFGSWCPHCQQFVPRTVRLANELAGSSVKLDFYGLPRGITGDPVARQANISAVPTAVIFIDGKEAGRWSTDDWNKPESALVRLINSSK